ncbi:hypothetical protein Rhe02_86990 [Rhizocola hellebori]|uniref:Uncharacterized protein n=1 Tax=Rhizocola hellebori TaxID=1392758 RepID=A0A8J3VLG5_9ACTN|nr:hypothetical protein [Rhizocola hellebori]GIH10632.1 hypothetical protein Rhe02_86990 [Rhizocola hellebori]
MSEAVTGQSAVDPPALDAHARLLEVSLDNALEISSVLTEIRSVLPDQWQHSGLGSFASAAGIFERYAAARAELLESMAATVEKLREAPALLEQAAENYRQTEWENESLMRHQGGGS